MAVKNRVFLGALLVALAAVLTFAFTPFLVSGGLRLWFWWQTRADKITFKVDKIETPLLRPIVLRGVHLQTSDDSALRIRASATTVVVGLNLQGILLRTRGRAIRNLSIDDLRAEVRRADKGSPISESTSNALHKLLPDNFKLDRVDVRIENGSSVVLLRNFSLSGSPIEAGRFHAGEAMITSPLFRQTFTELRGATSWEADRLTIAGLTLTRGLDVQSVSADLKHLGKRRIGFDFDLDAFGGKIRASIGSEWRSHHSNWNVAGSANDISLTQTAEAIGFTNRVGGLLHAGKFTYRGDLTDPMRANGSLWMELTAPAWRDREAELIMLGVSFYSRQLELQQLYIKQKKNQLTLSGEGTFPTTPSGWLQPDFRGNVSASIDDLGAFASLFGADRDEFAGRIAIEGTVNARDRNIGGNLSASGSALTMFKNSIDEFSAQVNLKRDELEIQQLELRRKGDVLRAQGKMDTSPEHNYSGSLDLTVNNVADYLSRVCGGTDAKHTSANIHATIASGAWETHGMIDPPASKPVRFAAAFPLPIGKPRDTLLNAPIRVTADFPALYLSEIPRCFTGSLFQGGILSGQVSMDATLKHPRIAGEIQLSDGRLGKDPKHITEANGHITLHGHDGTVSHLELGNKALSVSFYGTVDFQDADDVTMRLFPNQPLTDLNSGWLDCTNRLEIVSSTPTFPTALVGEVDLRGGIGRSNWTIALREPALGPVSGALEWDFTARTFRFCAAPNGNEEPVVLGIEPSLPPKTVRPRKHKQRD
jgi:hypothetical protein